MYVIFPMVSEIPWLLLCSENALSIVMLPCAFIQNSLSPSLYHFIYNLTV